MKWECVFEKMCVPMSVHEVRLCLYCFLSDLVYPFEEVRNILLSSSRYAAEFLILR